MAGCIVLWHRWTTLIDTIRWSLSFTGMFFANSEIHWRADGTGIILIGLWRRMTLLMWDNTMSTARKIKANRPDICLRNRKTNTFLIDISCPADSNIGKKHAKKLAKYSDLRVEISRMGHCRTLVVVVLGALGTAHAGISRWLDIISGHHNLQLVQKTVLLGSTRILLKVMSSF